MAEVDPRTWAAPQPTGVRRFVPILTWLRSYDRGSLRFDTVAGATIWGLLAPEMIAYAGLACVPPQAGLYTLRVAPAAYAVFGTSRHVVAAGTSAAAVLLASKVIALHPAGSSAYLTDAAALVVISGLLFVAAGLCRLGFVVQFLSRPVIEGFVFGLAIFVSVKQLPKLFGIEGGEGDTLRQLGHHIGHLGDTHGITLAVGLASLVLLFGGERWFPKIPGGLLVLVLGIIVSGAFDLSSHGVDVVGKVPGGLPSVSVPRPPRDDIVPLIGGALGMLLVIFSESLGAAQTFATKYGYTIDANQELTALGVASTASGLVGGLPGGGSLSQSAVNEGAGARSEVSPLVATVLAIVTVLFLTPVFKDLPEAVLAALIIHAVSHLWKVEEFRRYRRPPRGHPRRRPECRTRHHQRGVARRARQGAPSGRDRLRPRRDPRAGRRRGPPRGTARDDRRGPRLHHDRRGSARNRQLDDAAAPSVRVPRLVPCSSRSRAGSFGSSSSP
jgi:MFS superfamily sulfate permease-like transporter